VPTNDSFEFDYTPGYTKPTHEYGATFGDEFHAEAVQELLLSMSGYSQRGVTLAGGNGVLPTGCVLAQNTSTGKYVAYTAGGSNGTATALGILRDSRDTGGTSSPSGKASTDCQANLVYRGILNSNLISGTDTTSLVSGTGGGIGSGTTGAYTQLKPRIVAFGNGISTQNFPGGPMDGMDADGTGTNQGVNAWIF
jgi:hypothetical protein